MSILTGILQASLLVQPFADRTYLSSNVLSGGVSTFDPAPARLESPVEGGSTIYSPVIVFNTPKTGISPVGVNSFLYDRIIRQDGATRLDGFSINVGIIDDSDIVIQSLWNGFGEKITITDIDYSNPTSNVVVNAPVETEEFNPYEERELNITINIEGETLFDVDITITFDNGATYVFNVTGVRRPATRVLLSDANWKGGIRMESQYLTSIYRASDTSETRQARRDRPIRKIKYEIISTDANQAAIQWSFLQGLAGRRTYLPLLQDKSIVTQDSTGLLIHCDTVKKRYHVGDVIIIVLKDDKFIYHTGIIDGITDTTISVLSSALLTVIKGSFVFPGIYSEIELKGNSFETYKTTGAITTVSINEIFGTTTIQSDNSDYSPTLFYGDAFFTFGWNWKVLPKVSIKGEAIVLKGGRANTVISITNFTTISIEAVVSVHTRAEWWELTGFLNYIKGRYRAFWVKLPYEGYILGDYRLFDGSDLTEIEVITEGGINNMFSIQAIWTKDSVGVETIIKVDGIRSGLTEDSVILELDPTVVTDVVELRRAVLVRNTSDKITEQWFTDEGVVEVKMKMVELPGAYSS